MGVLYDSVYAHYVYAIIKKDCKGMDAIYEDYICHIVGVSGLFAMREYNLVESCGIVNGRQLYTLVSRD